MILTRLELEAATNEPGKTTVIIPTSSAPLWCLQLAVMSLLMRSDPARIHSLIVTVNGPADDPLQDRKIKWLRTLRAAGLINLTIQQIEGVVGHAEALESAMAWVHTEFVTTIHDDVIVVSPSWIGDAIAAFEADDRLALLADQLWTDRIGVNPWRDKRILYYPHLQTHFATWRKAAFVESGARWPGYHAPHLLTITPADVAAMRADYEFLPGLKFEVEPGPVDIVSNDIGVQVAESLRSHGWTMGRFPESVCRHMRGCSWGTDGRVLDGAEPHRLEIHGMREAIKSAGFAELVPEFMQQNFSAIGYGKMVEAHDREKIHIHQNLFEFREWLRRLEQIQPRTLIEIGTYKWGTAQMTLEMLPSVQRLVTIDIEDRLSERPDILDQYGDRLACIHGSTRDPATWERLRELLGGEADGAFVDGDHDYEPVKDDFERTLKMVRPGGVIGFHDCNRAFLGNLGSVRFFEELTAANPGRCELITCEADQGPWDDYGIGVYRV